MDVNSPDTWRLLWVVLAAIGVSCELLTPLIFVFLPIALGSAGAALATLVDWPLRIQWLLFFGLSIGSFLVLRPLGRRLEQRGGEQVGIGATRWIGGRAEVTEEIAGDSGRVMLDREEWRARSLLGRPIPTGTTVVITEVAGTRLLVMPVDSEETATDRTEPGPGKTGDRPRQGANQWPYS